MSKGFKVSTSSGQEIRFLYYTDEAPHTVQAFDKTLPFSLNFIHARVSGEEIWVEKGPQIEVIQENSSVFTKPGEVVIGPTTTARNKVSGCMGIFYGEGKGLDGSNIFARVAKEDAQRLVELGTDIWKNGEQELKFERL